MTKIVKFIYVMIIILSLFQLSKNAKGNPFLTFFILGNVNKCL
ncbi:hypothetical protein MtrunA17_Chr3g0090171 [Medicago truncatula]|uniref:Nodule Cysteine-Rich (NCR) secreted peptide n=1 Tax=Medicago truncatula TaxID=3880 RepID=A0A396IL92_MEDTR|nr:hypothetical protein MtrunA17_Chr3g0090171 [Medicago truncatula]